MILEGAGFQILQMNVQFRKWHGLVVTYGGAQIPSRAAVSQENFLEDMGGGAMSQPSLPYRVIRKRVGRRTCLLSSELREERRSFQAQCTKCPSTKDLCVFGKGRTSSRNKASQVTLGQPLSLNPRKQERANH